MNFNLAVILRETAKASPGKPVALYDGGRLTYAELDALSGRLAAGLQAGGVRPGDAVALQLPNIAQFLRLPPPPSKGAGSTPVTSATSTTTGSCSSPAGSRN